MEKYGEGTPTGMCPGCCPPYPCGSMPECCIPPYPYDIVPIPDRSPCCAHQHPARQHQQLSPNGLYHPAPECTRKQQISTPQPDTSNESCT
eukprot:3625672-Rhodomonas_salina.1